MSTPELTQALIGAAAKAAVIFTIAGAIDLGILRRRASASTRHLVWTIAIAGSLVVPLLGHILPPLDVPLPVDVSPAPHIRPSEAVAPLAPTTQSTVPPTIRAERSSAVTTAVPIEPNVAAPGTPVMEAPSYWSVETIALLVYGIGVTLLLLSVIVDHVFVWRITRRSEIVRDSRWTALLDVLRRRSGLRSRVVLRRSSAPLMPLTIGVVRPSIIIPNAAADWSPSLREAVLLHELAHVARRDCLTQSLAAIACALYWPNPLAWWAAARLRIEREHACDDLVLARGVEAHEYAGHLLGIARGLRTPRFAVSMAAPNGLEARLRALIDESRRRDVPARRATAITVGFALALVGGIAATRPARATEAPPVAHSARPTRDLEIRPVLVTSQPPAPRLTTAPTVAEPALPSPQQSRAIERGEFHVRLAAPSDGPRNAGRIHFMLMSPGLNTFYEPAANVDGLSPNQLMLNGTPLEFRLRRDAGTFRFSGTARDGRGSGRFEFTDDPSFVDSLSRRGVRAPSPRQQFNFARHDVSLAYVDALLKEGYAAPTPEQLDRAGMSSVDIDYVREMAALGYRTGTVDALVNIANRGVNPAEILALAALGYRNLTLGELIALDDQTIDTAFVRAANARAGRQLSVRELVAYRRGSDMSTARASAPQPAPAVPSETRDTPVLDDTVTTGRWTLVARGDGWLQLDIEWANVNQWRRFVRPSELAGFPAAGAADLAQAAFRIQRDAGVFAFDGTFGRGRGSGQFSFTPNRGFPATMRSLGVREADVVGIHDLKNLAFGDIDAQTIRDFGSAGLSAVTVDELVTLAIRQVTPGYLRELKALGVRGLDSVEEIVSVRFASVPVAYMRELNELGYTALDYRDLVELYRAGVSAAFIREQHASGRRNITPQELIDARRGRR